MINVGIRKITIIQAFSHASLYALSMVGFKRLQTRYKYIYNYLTDEIDSVLHNYFSAGMLIARNFKTKLGQLLDHFNL